jgi:allantoicase/malate synthase
MPRYADFLSEAYQSHLQSRLAPVPGVPGMLLRGEPRGLELGGALRFLAELSRRLEGRLGEILKRRAKDRAFVDERTRACHAWNRAHGVGVKDPAYRTVIGLEDSEGRVVVGPLRPDYARSGGANVAPIPAYLQGPHVTLFGPPDSARMAVNAMNAWHRKLKGEPPVVETLLAEVSHPPRWGADDEDSKTPLHGALVDAGVNLSACFERTLETADAATGKVYRLAADHLSQPIKRFPGLALPSPFLFLDGRPVPLHLYDFALHLFHHWSDPAALAFYVPKLENEEEARYVHDMVEEAEALVAGAHPSYVKGSVRLLVVLENPRAILRTHEIMDALYPYFAGASLGWHDYLGSTARLFREDGDYRIPVKADPEIVIKYIHASHRMLAEVVGSRGGIQIGGMYGILPVDTDLASDSFQVTLEGFFKDGVTQLKRGLTGFWVAHPDFVRLGMALVQAWRHHEQGDGGPLRAVVEGMLAPARAARILEFIARPDVKGLDHEDPGYVRALLVADLEESKALPNGHPDEVRYNIFQALQYLADWLAGNGCVALPAHVNGTPVRVMDDLATAERSRWELWHEVRHGRVPVEDFVRMAHEELNFIRRDLSDEKKIVQVKWAERTARWYPVALELLLQLVTDPEPVEFASQLLLPFTDPDLREEAEPLAAYRRIDAHTHRVPAHVERFHRFFDLCGCQRFASEMAALPALDEARARACILSFTRGEIVEAASFHGDIGHAKTSLDKLARAEQSRVQDEDTPAKARLRELGAAYRARHGVKFLVSAQGKTPEEMLALLERRLGNPTEVELDNARAALWEITRKRLASHAPDRVLEGLEALRSRHGVRAVSVALTTGAATQVLASGCTPETQFEIASLSKTVASAFALEFFASRGVTPEARANALLADAGSPFRLSTKRDGVDPEAVTLAHLVGHLALNHHYVKGVPLSERMPDVAELISGSERWGYEPVTVLHPPGTRFSYSGGGYLVLEHLVQAATGMRVQDAARPFLDSLGLSPAALTFEQQGVPGVPVATGHFDGGREVPGGRLQFPAFAAGALGTSGAVLDFLRHLERAFWSVEGSCGISHDTAVRMLHGTDKGCRDFMGCDMGLGVFVAEAEENRFAIHQGANEGFRALYLHCFQGPDRGKGFVVLCNADNAGVAFVAEVAQLLLRELGFRGVDLSRFGAGFDFRGLQQEQIVNLGYRDLVFSAFLPRLPEPIRERGPLDPLAGMNLLARARIMKVTDQRFARAENLVSDRLPVFDPLLYCSQGKVMDSWESARHNPEGVDSVTLELPAPAPVRFVQLSTKFHDGNHAEAVRLWSRPDAAGEWLELLPKIPLQGHSLLRLELPEGLRQVVRQVRVEMFPDGGLSRLGLFTDVPGEERAEFRPLASAACVRFEGEIPKPAKPLTLPFERREPTALSGRRDWASLASGGRVVSASNQHYGPASQVISPFPPLHMFDGFESARSRVPGHHEELVLELGREIAVDELRLDFTWFVNNNPCFVRILVEEGSGWTELCPKTWVKPFAGNWKVLRPVSPRRARRVKLEIFPDGGINRVQAWGQ